MVRNSDSGAAMQIAAPQLLTIRSIPPLEREVDEAITIRVSVVDLDLRGTQTIDSAGLNWMINTQSRLAATGIQLRLSHLPRIVSDILMATRLDHRFVIVDAEPSHA